MLKKRSIRFARRARRESKQLASDLGHLFHGTYRPFSTKTGLSIGQLGIPQTQFSLINRRIVHTFDFLPDWLSFSGTRFQDSLHVDFVRAYLKDSQFDYRNSTYYRRAVKGNLPYPCRGVRAAEARCRQFTLLINRFQQEGYQPHEFGPITFVECIDGTTMVLNGKHRLATLMALGIHEFPAVVCFDNEVKAQVRDVWERRNWPRSFHSKSYRMFEKMGTPVSENQSAAQAVINTIKHLKLETGADIYHPIPFYEFRNLSTQVSYETPYQRLAMILSHYQNLQGKRVLDLGCNVGFYSFSLAKRGATVTGIDIRPEYVDIASDVARIYGAPITFLNMPITTEFIKDEMEEVDVTLCFSTLQWVIAQNGMDYGNAVLRAVSEKSRALFFDISVNSGHACLKCTPGRERTFVEELLREATVYPYIRHIGDVHPYGSDTRHVFYCSHLSSPERR